MSATSIVSVQPTRSVSLTQLFHSPRHLACLHPSDEGVDLDRELIDESPFEIDPRCVEPLMPDVVCAEDTHADHWFGYVDDEPAPEEPEHLAIGPHVAQAVLQYAQMEPVACVW
jgi:hypothetical protein